MDPNTPKKPVVIGLVHANWCGHCRNLMPIWKQMESNIERKPYHPPPVIMKVEHSEMNKLDDFNTKNAAYLNGQSIQSDGFPTIFKVRNGIIDYYKENREPIEMEKWFMEEQFRDASASASANKTRTKKTKRRHYRNRRKTAGARRRRRTISRRMRL